MEPNMPVEGKTTSQQASVRSTIVSTTGVDPRSAEEMSSRELEDEVMRLADLIRASMREVEWEVVPGATSIFANTVEEKAGQEQEPLQAAVVRDAAEKVARGEA
jgi:hypothetical protein